ncbi:MAG: hypothetical protein ACD_5C00329G0003 [uncultured bacterium]|nr:MAG: hypothetical protein ACD_5C00329G0003 [uncultured bacterium]
MTATRRKELDEIKQQRAALIAEAKEVRQQFDLLPKNLRDFKDAVFLNLAESKESVSRDKLFKKYISLHPDLNTLFNKPRNEIPLFSDGPIVEIFEADLGRVDIETKQYKQDSVTIQAIENGLAEVLKDIVTQYYRDYVFPNYPSDIEQKKARKVFYDSFSKIAFIKFSTAENSKETLEFKIEGDIHSLLNSITQYLRSQVWNIEILAKKIFSEFLEKVVEEKLPGRNEIQGGDFNYAVAAELDDHQERFKNYIGCAAKENIGWGILAATYEFSAALTPSGQELVNRRDKFVSSTKTLDEAHNAAVKLLDENTKKYQKELMDFKKQWDDWRGRINADILSVQVYFNEFHVAINTMTKQITELEASFNQSKLEDTKQKLLDIFKQYRKCRDTFCPNKILLQKLQNLAVKIREKEKEECVVAQQPKDTQLVKERSGSISSTMSVDSNSSNNGNSDVSVASEITQHSSNTQKDHCREINDFIYAIIMGKGNLVNWNRQVSFFGKMNAYLDGARITDEETGKTFSVPRGIYLAMKHLKDRENKQSDTVLLEVLKALDGRLAMGSRYCTREKPTNILYSSLIEQLLAENKKGLKPLTHQTMAELRNIFLNNDNKRFFENFTLPAIPQVAIAAIAVV